MAVYFRAAWRLLGVAGHENISDAEDVSPPWHAAASTGVAFWRGVRETPTVPALTLFALFFGVGALANQSGLSLFEVVFTSIFMFAGPAQMALADQMMHGVPLVAAALTVSATGVRLFPMTLALVPEVRDRSVPRWVEYVIAHFVGVTMWFETMRRVSGVPTQLRAGYAIGLSVYLLLASLVGAVLGYLVTTEIPETISAAFLIISPIYFMLSMLGGVRKPEGMIPVGIGFMLAPVLHTVFPKMDLLLTGVTGGSVAFWLMWLISRHTPPPRRLAARSRIGSENAFFDQLRQIPTGVWIISQLPWLLITVPPLAHYGIPHVGPISDTLIYILIAISASLPLWVIWNTPTPTAGAKAEIMPFGDQTARSDDPRAASSGASPFGDLRQIPLRVWVLSQLPWLFFIIPPIAAYGGLGERFVYILLAGVAANEIWRMAGAALSSNLKEEGIIIQWAKVVSTTLIAGLVARFIFAPPGVLMHVGLTGRVGAFFIGVAVYYFASRSLTLGIVTAMLGLMLFHQLMPV